MLYRHASIILVFFALASSAFAQESCNSPADLLRIDATWERALLESDADAIDKLLAEDFIWVHDHAGTIDNKASVLKRALAGRASGKPKSRISSDLSVHALGTTGVVTGFTVIERPSGPRRYNFMRTYVSVSGQCLLLANHTMAVPDSE